jgi:4-hydroxy-tetrahydrodipicolinate reductase
MRLAIAGAGGKMGRALVEATLADGSLKLAAVLDAAGSPALGTQIGGLTVGSDVRAAVSAADVLIDFTRPEGTLAHLDACAAAGKAMVIGTTGFSAAQLSRIQDASTRIAVALSPNFAVGVNVVFRLAETAAAALGDSYDVEIIEAHHRQKVDAPSGTALMLGNLVAGALGRNLDEVAAHGREGDVGARPAKEIGFHSIRGGDIVGEHTVVFAGTGERVEIAVRSQSRATYATGALRAAKFLQAKKNGLYDMKDVLGLK